MNPEKKCSHLKHARFENGVDPGKPAKESDGPRYPGDTEWVTNTEFLPWNDPGAQLVLSKLDGTFDHAIAVDIDLPCHLIETSPGKNHLIIEKRLTWPQYRALLIALAQAGVIEEGYLEASLARGFTSLRIHPDTPRELPSLVQPDASEIF